jgi:FkbM family methyltransferase
MGAEFTVFGVWYKFDSESNKNIICLDWFLSIFHNGRWEPETFEVFEYAKDSNKAAVDIGSWIGPTSIWLSNNFKHVISIEPDVVAFEALEQNLKNSGCHNVDTINRPCYKEETDVVFGTNEFKKDYPDSFLGASTSQIKSSQVSPEDRLQKTITLGHLKNYSCFHDIGFVKVDIEGGEENILEDLFEYANTYKWKLYVSFHCDWWRHKVVSIFRCKELFDLPTTRIVHMAEKKNLSSDELLRYIVHNPMCSVYFEFGDTQKPA